MLSEGFCFSHSFRDTSPTFPFHCGSREAPEWLSLLFHLCQVERNKISPQKIDQKPLWASFTAREGVKDLNKAVKDL